MCFSAIASFTAAAIMADAGAVALKLKKKKTLILLAFVPILFALQQVSDKHYLDKLR